jgi:hypothetical protein
MHEASFTGLIRTLAIFFVIYYSLKIIGRYVLPLFVKRTMSRMEDRFRAQQGAQEPQGKVGETTIDKAPQTVRKKSPSGGDYIDFEEVD